MVKKINYQEIEKTSLLIRMNAMLLKITTNLLATKITTATVFICIKHGGN
jgi:hypothetical protein